MPFPTSGTTTLAIYLIRHGETEWSRSGRHTGITDVPLTERGARMARDLAPVLADVRFATVLVSPRQRAQDTCRLAGLGDGAEVEPDLAEWDYGDYEGLRSVEIQAARADWDIWRDGCPGGESPAAVSARADRVVARLRDLPGDVAVFSHGHFGRVLTARWLRQPVEIGQHLILDPATLCVLDLDARHGNVPVILRWNVSASLP